MWSIAQPSCCQSLLLILKDSTDLNTDSPPQLKGQSQMCTQGANSDLFLFFFFICLNCNINSDLGSVNLFLFGYLFQETMKFF